MHSSNPRASQLKQLLPFLLALALGLLALGLLLVGSVRTRDLLEEIALEPALLLLASSQKRIARPILSTLRLRLSSPVLAVLVKL